MLDLKQRRLELSLTMLDVAKLVGVSESTISRYESGNIRNMRRDRIEKYARALQVSPSDFLDINSEIELRATDDIENETPPIEPDIGRLHCKSSPLILTSYADLPKAPKGSESPKKRSVLAMLDTQHTEFDRSVFICLPLIKRISFNIDYSDKANIDIADYSISTNPKSYSSEYNHFWFEVSDDSMEPELHKHDNVLIEESTNIVNECLALVCVDKEDGSIKRIKNENNEITVSSINPYYPPRVFKNDDIKRVKIIGKVIKVERNIN